MAQTRRQMIGGMAGILASGVAPGAVTWCSSVGVEKDGGHNLPVDLVSMQTKKTAKDYVQDGLIAMWDGIENAGWGVHDDGATVWKDLVSGIDCEAIGSPTWGDNCFVSPSNVNSPYFNAHTPDLSNTDGHTVEIISLKSSVNRGIIFGSYGISGANYCSFEYYGRNFRSYYAGYPDFATPVDSWPLNEIKYFASLRSGDLYSICGADGAVISTKTSPERRFKASPMRIGTDSRTAAMCFYGNIYAIRIYNRALTASEIAANYAVDKARFNL